MKPRIISFLLFVLTLISCSKDKENKSNEPNQFTYKGNIYELSQGYILTYDNDGEFAFGLIGPFSTSNIDVQTDSENEKYIDFEGSGYLFWIEGCLYPINNPLANGTYTFNEDAEIFEFEEGGLYLNVDFNTWNGSELELFITSGQIDFKKLSNNQYEIDFSLTLDDETELEGYYKGELILAHNYQ